MPQEEAALQAQVRSLEEAVAQARETNRTQEAVLRQERRKREQFLGPRPPS